MGGSQGASALNELAMKSAGLLRKQWESLQIIHLTGPQDYEHVRRTYAAQGQRAAVFAFLAEMDLALGAATAALTRAGASTLAELAAQRLPAVLVPYPHAADDHQFHNAQSLERDGAARLLEEKRAEPLALVKLLTEIVSEGPIRRRMQDGLRRWHKAGAADAIARRILEGHDRPAEELASDRLGAVGGGASDAVGPGDGVGGCTRSKAGREVGGGTGMEVVGADRAGGWGAQ
jgi:UDP-N-acetylglucosamine--N-acetylmuramyl-(pentapeptide) pyrophosphoryl-undecaprenol N-acetylglucosamine transferase